MCVIVLSIMISLVTGQLCMYVFRLYRSRPYYYKNVFSLYYLLLLSLFLLSIYICTKETYFYVIIIYYTSCFSSKILFKLSG